MRFRKTDIRMLTLTEIFAMSAEQKFNAFTDRIAQGEFICDLVVLSKAFYEHNFRDLDQTMEAVIDYLIESKIPYHSCKAKYADVWKEFREKWTKTKERKGVMYSSALAMKLHLSTRALHEMEEQLKLHQINVDNKRCNIEGLNKRIRDAMDGDFEPNEKKKKPSLSPSLRSIQFYEATAKDSVCYGGVTTDNLVSGEWYKIYSIDKSRALFKNPNGLTSFTVGVVDPVWSAFTGSTTTLYSIADWGAKKGDKVQYGVKRPNGFWNFEKWYTIFQIQYGQVEFEEEPDPLFHIAEERECWMSIIRAK